MGKIKEYYYELQNLWMGRLEEERKEYEKRRCLLPNDGSDWRRERF